MLNMQISKEINRNDANEMDEMEKSLRRKNDLKVH